MGRRSTVQNRCLLTSKTTRERKGRRREQWGVIKLAWKEEAWKIQIDLKEPAWVPGRLLAESQCRCCLWIVTSSSGFLQWLHCCIPEQPLFMLDVHLDLPRSLLTCRFLIRGSGLGSKILHFWQALGWYWCSWCLKTSVGIEHLGLHPRPKESESAVYHIPRWLKCTYIFSSFVLDTTYTLEIRKKASQRKWCLSTHVWYTWNEPAKGPHGVITFEFLPSGSKSITPADATRLNMPDKDGQSIRQDSCCILCPRGP